MSWSRWLPLRFIIRRAAKSQGFLDPLDLLARLRNLSQPSEVAEPIELLRAGVVFHARGLINSKVIQHNLDWVWPYWVERQYNPYDISFMPRAFSVSHINLTHRNWTAIGYPDCLELPVVDPRGMLTPHYDGWSLDSWIITNDGRTLLPSKVTEVCHEQSVQGSPAVTTHIEKPGLTLVSRATVKLESGRPTCILTIKAEAETSGWLVLALRPQNPEGISFIHQVSLSEDRKQWVVDDTVNQHAISFSEPAARHFVSNYRHGDVFMHLTEGEEKNDDKCAVDLLTASACFELQADTEKEVTIKTTLAEEELPENAWTALEQQCCRLECPEPHYRFLYDAAVASLILHSPGDVYPGPYTYKRFWFRDAAFIIHALLCVGLKARAKRALDNFPDRQTPLGYFLSQEGEWDSNGEALWILKRYEELTGATLNSNWLPIIKRGAKWIGHKRLADKQDSPHAGLMPAGFSAEHLGPNDYYYWDDFWSVEGLRAAASLLDGEDDKAAAEFRSLAGEFESAIDRSLDHCATRLQRKAMPASPYRRLDAGCIGSLATGYPLQLCEADDPRLLDTVEYLLQKCFVDGAFFQDMIHSGLNAYLTLHVAQILLRADDPRYLELMDAVVALATTTGQWPEAIHPHTKGGCMGDGHHVWASAEWILMIRNCFVREEDNRLVLCAGVPTRWLDQEEPVFFGPAPTSFGDVSVKIQAQKNEVSVNLQADWRNPPASVAIRLPGCETLDVQADTGPVTLKRMRNKA